MKNIINIKKKISKKKKVLINLKNNKIYNYDINKKERKDYLSFYNNKINYNLFNRLKILIELKRVPLEEYDN